jgi:uncharacterized protein YecT (DUF1311 family)
MYFLLAFALKFTMSLSDTECTDRPECWPEGSAMHTSFVAKQKFADADKRLNSIYSRILKSLLADEPDNYPKKALIAAQREWVKYRDANCASVGEVSGGVRMWKSAYTVSCEAEMTEERIKELVRVFDAG